MDKPTFAPAFWQALAKDNPLGDTTISAQDARDWFDLIWPVYREHGRERAAPAHRRRIAAWWVRLRPVELERSRERAVNLVRSAASARFSPLSSVSLTEHASPRTDAPPLKVVRGVARG